jgi:UDP-N-acetylglucosamine/UDP-N-acetylgalactosamine 4-epimerase
MAAVMMREGLVGIDMPNPPARWLVTGAAGFIGSNLCSALLASNQEVVGLDNLSTGHKKNIERIQKQAYASQGTFRFIEGDILQVQTCIDACSRIDYILHQAALGSVPRSIANPLASHYNNVDGFIHMLEAAVKAKVKRFVYASSSSVYGDHPALPKVEEVTGNVISPYAATKAINEIYAGVFQKVYGLQCVGLRYFNVFGPHQDPAGAYAAVIPRWIAAAINNEPLKVFGDGSTSRDFCYITNVIQANVKAALTDSNLPDAQVYNIAVGEQTSLAELAKQILIGLKQIEPLRTFDSEIQYLPFRAGDVQHSLANIGLAQRQIDYRPMVRVQDGLKNTVQWYLEQQRRETQFSD